MIWVVLVLTVVILLCVIYQESLKKQKKARPLHKNYLKGLNFLLNEQPDKAVDIFIKMLQVDTDTVETHLALARLYRKSGEVDKAIKIHQNLIARPTLEKHFRVLTLNALGQDYLTAGVLDRAERVFDEVITLDERNELALVSLLDIYQQEKNWDKAIEVAEILSLIVSNNLNKDIAHYYCELADYSLNCEEADQALLFVKRALAADKYCVRANFIQAQVYMNSGQYKHALKCLKKVKDQSPEFLFEVVEPLSQCFDKLGDEKGLINYLHECLQQYPQTPLFLSLAEKLREIEGVNLLSQEVHSHVRKQPSVEGVNLFLKLSQSDLPQSNQVVESVCELIDLMVRNRPKYLCESCGFSGKTLRWQCPSCRLWGSVKPIHSYDNLRVC